MADDVGKTHEAHSETSKLPVHADERAGHDDLEELEREPAPTGPSAPRAPGDSAAEPPLKLTDDTGPLPHWTDPPTGDIPRIFASDRATDDDFDDWSSLAARGPVWQGERTSSGEPLGFEDLIEPGDPPSPDADVDDPFDLPWDDAEGDDDDEMVEAGALGAIRSGASAPAAAAAAATSASPPPVGPGRRARLAAAQHRGAPRNGVTGGFTATRGVGGRDMPKAVGAGVLLAAIALLLFMSGPAATMVLVTVVCGVGAGEFYGASRRAGYHPATLLGLGASIAAPLARYWRGDTALAAVAFVFVVFAFLFMIFVDREENKVANLAVTVLGFAWVGVLGSFAAGILQLPNGIGILLGAILCTVAYDVFGLIVGSAFGRTQLAPEISPNKTWEGLIGAWLCVLIVALCLNFLFGGLVPWDVDMLDAVRLGIVVAVAATIGDLAESAVKRDLGIKDMSDVIPGHGGVLDRFDGLLFVLPAVYYLALGLDFANR